MKAALADLPCVSSVDAVDVDFSAKTATVKVDKETYDEAELLKALEDAGQPATIESEDGASSE